MAIGAMRAIDERSLRIPEDVSVIGCDDIPLAESILPALTTLRIPAKHLGRRIMFNILQCMNGNEPTSVSMPIELIIRKSTGRAKTAE